MRLAVQKCIQQIREREREIKRKLNGSAFRANTSRATNFAIESIHHGNYIQHERRLNHCKKSIEFSNMYDNLRDFRGICLYFPFEEEIRKLCDKIKLSDRNV